MAPSYKFGVIKFVSDSLRSECLNVGLLIESGGGWLIRSGKRLEKVRVISAALDSGDVASELSDLPDLLERLEIASFDDLQKIKCVSDFTSLKVIEQGSFTVHASLFEHTLQDLLSRYVDAEPVTGKQARKRPSKLRHDIWLALRSEKVLANPSEGLESHRVLYKHELAQGIVADFLLKNGAMHVVESVDASGEGVSLARCISEVAMSALTFEQTRISYRNIYIKPRLVYTASAEMEKAIAPSLYAAEHQGAELINWASIDDRNRFLIDFSGLAQPKDQRVVTPDLFHASTLPLRKLN